MCLARCGAKRRQEQAVLAIEDLLIAWFLREEERASPRCHEPEPEDEDDLVDPVLDPFWRCQLPSRLHLDDDGCLPLVRCQLPTNCYYAY